jgi:hypothetical protein
MTWLVTADFLALGVMVFLIAALPSLLRWRVAAFERTYGYDAGYIRSILDASTRAMLRLSAFQIFAAQRRGLPRDAFYAARIAGTMAEDCGPCTQLVVTMAEREHVAPATLRAIVARDLDAASPEAALAVRFVEAVIARDLLRADALRSEVVSKWGDEAVVSLAFAIATSRVYPTLKYSLGFGRACSRVQVAGVEQAVVRAAHVE